VLTHAIADAKQEALEILAVVDPHDPTAIQKQQALILALEELTTTLERYILAQV